MADLYKITKAKPGNTLKKRPSALQMRLGRGQSQAGSMQIVEAPEAPQMTGSSSTLSAASNKEEQVRAFLARAQRDGYSIKGAGPAIASPDMGSTRTTSIVRKPSPERREQPGSMGPPRRPPSRQQQVCMTTAPQVRQGQHRPPTYVEGIGFQIRGAAGRNNGIDFPKRG